MKKGILSVLFMAGWSIATLYAHTIDEFVSDDQLNTQALPECPAKHIHIDDFDRYFDATPEEKKTYRRYHASELLGIEKGDQPPYEAFRNPASHQEELEKLLIVLLELGDGKDVCDQEGIKYIARLYHYFCPGSENFKSLSLEAQATVENLLERRGTIFDLARDVSNCSYVRKEKG